MKQKKIILGVGFVLGLLSLALFLYTYDDCRPEASLDVRIDKKMAAGMADEFIHEHGLNTQGYERTVTLEFKDQFYLKKTLGMKETTRLIRHAGVPCWSWQVRYFLESQKEEIRVYLNPSTGEIIYFSHALMDDAAAESISHDEAKFIAEKILLSLNKYEEFELIQDSFEELANRKEHVFEWKAKNIELADATLHVYVAIAGNKLGHYAKYVEVPDGFYRLYQREATPSMIVYFVFGVLNVLINIGMLVALFLQYRYSKIRWKFSGAIALVFVAVSLIEVWNFFPVTQSDYYTALTKNMYLTIHLGTRLFGILLTGLWIFLTCAVGDSLSRDIGIDAFPVLRLLKERNFSSPQLRERIAVAYILGLLRTGYVTLFYLVAIRFVHAWKILPSNYAVSFSAYLPFALPLTMLITDTLTNELKYRLFAISFFKKYLKLTWLAVLLSSFFWVFGNYNVAIFPAYLKGIELVTLGVIWGFAFKRYGIETVLWAETVFAFILVAMPLLRSPVDFFHTAGIILVVILLLPLGLFLFPSSGENSSLNLPQGAKQ